MEIPPPYVAVYGGAFIDTKWRACGKIYRGSSTAGEKSEHFGGVARNLAESLAWLKIPCSLISGVGYVALGQRLIDHLKQLAIDTDDIYISPNLPTANYCAFFRKTGELYAAFTDLRLYECLNASWLEAAILRNQHARIHLLDTDLPTKASLQITKLAKGEIWVTITCVSTAPKILPILADIDALFLNWHELQSLIGNLPLKEAVAAVLKQGVGLLVVTLGNDGAYFASEALAFHCPALKTKVHDVTGAGDALAAGFLAAYLHGNPFTRCLEFGMQSASLTVQTIESVSPKLRDIAHLLIAR